MIFNLYKQKGETPLECLQKFRKAKNIQDKMTYLGRLDPLAEGVLLVGSGEDTSQENREKFFALDKEYDFVAVFGFATDTYDIMGKVVREENVDDLNEMEIRKVAMIYEGEREQKYPKYSSKIQGWENYSLASDSSQFSRKIFIYKLQTNKLETLSHKEFFGRILMDISKVKGDFRQAEILELWQEKLFKHPENKIFLGHFKAHVSSGTYVRSLVNDMGNTLGCGATVLSIKRTRVGDYQIKNSLQF
ncbi:MAG: hypothetical protein GX627_00940 [Parcubacteria group bacterium]|jgi:tRNA pseudouridine55 synthase|nr:hypothetical protein [Parcubacteria group bacterium]